MTTVLIMAGGTGGHVFPALAVAHVLRNRDCRVVWLGTQKGIESRLVPAANIPIEWIRVSGVRGKGAVSWLTAPFRVARAVMDAMRVVRKIRPDVVLGMGGFVAGPGGIAARLLGCPLVIHEQNAVAGFTNRILARIAKVVAEAFPGSFSPSIGAISIGNPVRADIEAVGDRRPSIRRPPNLLVFGGSQGALALNRIVPTALAQVEKQYRPSVMHQTGRGRVETTRAAYQTLGIEADVCEFIDDMAAAYTWADFVIARSGALTVAELAAAGLPSVLVPFPAAVDDHQTVNAKYLESRGAAVLMPEATFSPGDLANIMKGLMDQDGARLSRMSIAARSAAKTGTAVELAELCLNQIKRRAA
jgi:UDP-N-acetylglucosamine--N-acetylmuramyl-(pentapeptide) pyrophosphoryl-undecaprenol N-acetylglucosamine transferase